MTPELISLTTARAIEAGDFIKAYKTLPEAVATPYNFRHVERCMRTICRNLFELSEHVNELRFELREDWTPEQVRAFMAGMWQGFKASTATLEGKVIAEIHAK